MAAIPNNPETIQAYEEWPCLGCGTVPNEWALRYHGPNLAAYCPDCGSRLGGNSQWVNKSKAGLSRRSVRTGSFSPSQVFDILERDEYTCFACGKDKRTVLLQVDHIWPVHLGGPAVIENGITLCEQCNLGKSKKFAKTFVWRALGHTHLKGKDYTPEEFIEALASAAESARKWVKEAEVEHG